MFNSYIFCSIIENDILIINNINNYKFKEMKNKKVNKTKHNKTNNKSNNNLKEQNYDKSFEWL